MATRMLIDARHPEETRVAVLKGNRIEEFDFESAEHKQIKGNIYLAKVTRVEPSLQAAFVDFGGNRHGFLAFGEIHPDYYQIPKEDREALIADEAAAAAEEAALLAEEEEEEEAAAEAFEGEDGGEAYADEMAGENVEEIDTSEKDEVATIEGGQFENGEAAAGDEPPAAADAPVEESDAAETESDEETPDEEENRPRRGRRGNRHGKRGSGGKSRAKQFDEVREKRMALRRRYKIQDVIQRRQVLLIQVVKEERGNKGAALTTYLSLAGRYCVLMPNSSHGGGISRKISNASDRKRLKQVVAELKLPKSMGCIVRTAGLQRNKTEIKRDFDYLARLWDEIRETTLKSTAPMLIHSDSDLIKRAIRDIYNKEIEDVVVEGAEGYKAAKEFMKLLMPSHAKRVQAYSDPVPLFQRYGAEDQLSAMYDPVVQLKSGGYLVINPTEALVSIDINSGRSTKEHGIEQTALNTNLEAAREIARQLRLRDMAGLLVIDFIDMEYSSNIRKVERAMKDALKFDRARIQVGRISGFGLMEMSRQRLRTGVLEATTRSCPHCDGTGLVRTASSAGLSALRLIEDEAAKGKGNVITLYASTEATIYLLNAKRADLSEIESRYGVTVQVVPEGEQEGAKMRVSSSGDRPTSVPRFEPIVVEDDDEEFEEEIEEEEGEEREERDERSDEPRKRRRRRGGRGRKKHRDHEDGGESGEANDRPAREERSEPAAGEDGEDRPRKRRRRGGRGRKKRFGESGESQGQSEPQGEAWEEAGEAESGEPGDVGPENGEVEAEAADVDDSPAKADENQPKAKRGRRKKAEPDEPAAAAEPAAETAVAEEAPKPARGRGRKKAAEPEIVADAAAPMPEPATADADDAGSEGGPRHGWWQRTFGEE